MRIRNVKPEFYRSDDIDTLTWEQRFLFIALFSYVDDNGVGRDRESDICADLFAGDFSADPGETLGRVRQGLLALVRQGLVLRYEVEGKRYLFITGWDDHQYVKNPNRERYPRPDKALLQVSVEPGETLGSDSVDATPALPPVVGSGLLVVGSKNSAPKVAGVNRFPEFWAAYPIKKDRVNAEKAYMKQIRAGADHDQIMAGLATYTRLLAMPGAPSPKYAQGWLNGRRWEDETGQPEEQPLDTDWFNR